MIRGGDGSRRGIDGQTLGIFCWREMTDGRFERETGRETSDPFRFLPLKPQLLRYLYPPRIPYTSFIFYTQHALVSQHLLVIAETVSLLLRSPAICDDGPLMLRARARHASPVRD